MTRRLIALLAVVALAAGCGRIASPREGAPVDPDSPVSSSPADPGSPIPSPTPRLVEPRDGLENPSPSSFTRARIVDQRTVDLEFFSGVESCYGLDRVDVEYGTQTVILTIYTGTVSGAHVCIDLAEFVYTRVHLAEDLGGRTIVDGAAGAS